MGTVTSLLMLFTSAAMANIRYLDPQQVKTLPQNVKTELAKDRCMIPTVPNTMVPSGWTRGSFAKKGQTDWAVLCSVKGKSKIKIVWGGKSNPCPDSFGLNSDNSYLQNLDGSGAMTFSRMISSVKPNIVVEYLKRWKQPVPDKFDQDGVIDAFMEKASSVHFCTSGKWQEAPAGD